MHYSSAYLTEVCKGQICYYITRESSFYTKMEHSCYFYHWVFPWFSVLVQWWSWRLSLVNCLFLDPVAACCLVFLAAWVGGGCRTWKETWTACWLTDEVEVGGGWKLRLAGFSDHRDWLTQFSRAAPVPLSITRLVFPLKPTTLTHCKQLQRLSEASNLVSLDPVQRAVRKLLFLSAGLSSVNCLTDFTLNEFKYFLHILMKLSGNFFGDVPNSRFDFDLWSAKDQTACQGQWSRGFWSPSNPLCYVTLLSNNAGLFVGI